MCCKTYHLLFHGPCSIILSSYSFKVHFLLSFFFYNIYDSIFEQVDWQDVDDRHLPPLHFNISHTSSLIACGVTVNSPVSIVNIHEPHVNSAYAIFIFSCDHYNL
jgi:hypothetical protein